MPPAGFEPTISASEHLKTHVLDRAATANGQRASNSFNNMQAAYPVQYYDCELHVG
jgi:hypothetical protein